MGKIIEQTETIKEVMMDLKRGIYNIPRFQREFVWKASKIIGLINSIESNFPFGVILLADSKNSSLGGRNQIIDLISREYKNNGKVVVDGQQRLTSITIIYYAHDLSQLIKRGEVKKGIQSTLLKVYNSICFFNNVFFTTDDLAEKIKDEENISESMAKAKARNYLIAIPEINESIKNKIGNTKVFTHTLRNWTDSEIIDIFTALNQKVMPLTHVNLMNGSMFNISQNNFDLLGFINSSNIAWQNWGKIKPALFVQLMKIYSDVKMGYNHNNVSYKSDELVKWSGDKNQVDEFIENKLNFRNLIIKTMSLMEKKFKFYSVKHVPKDVYFLVIFSLMCKLDEKDTHFDKNIKFAVSHITKRLVNGDYASSPNAKAQDDIKYLFKYIDNPLQEDMYDYGDWEESLKIKLSNLKYKNKNDALFKIVLSVLSTNQPMNLFIDEPINVTPSSVTEMQFDIHHFIPTKSNFALTYNFGEFLHEIGNLALFSIKENRDIINARDPYDYLNESKNILGTENFKKAVTSHFFDYDLILKLMELDENHNSVQVHNLIRKIFKERRENILNKIKLKYFDFV